MSYIGGPLPEVDEEDKDKPINPVEGFKTWAGSVGRVSNKLNPDAGKGGLLESESDIIDQGISNITTSISDQFNQLDPKHQQLLIDGANLVKGAYKYTKENPLDTYILPSAAIHTVEGLGKWWQMGHGLRSAALQFVGIDKGAADKIALGRQLTTGRAFPKVTPKRLGISQSISKIKTLPEPTVVRSLINVTPGQSIFSMPTPKVKGAPKPKGLLRKYQNPKGGEVYDPNVFISKAEMSAMLNTMTVDGAEGYGLFSVKPATDIGGIGDLKGWNLPSSEKGSLETLVSDWSREASGELIQQGMTMKEIVPIIKKRITKEWTGAGITLGGDAHRVGQSDLAEVLLDPKKALTIKSKVSLDKRDLASKPTNDPQVQRYFKIANQVFLESGGQRGLNPKYNLEAYGKHISQMAAFRDRTTSNMAKSFGWNKATTNSISEWVSKSHALDKEHARSLFGGASNDWLSQFFGSAGRNRSSGKLDDFTFETMEILGAPTNKPTFSWDSKNREMVRNVHPSAQWNANLESATNWAAEQMQIDRDLAGDTSKPYFNPVNTLLNKDWVRIQSAFGKNQEEVAMRVIREAEIRRAWQQADLGTDPQSLEVLSNFMEKIWEMDVELSKQYLERTIGEYGMKKAFSEMNKFNPKTSRFERDKLAPYEGVTIQQPGAKINPKTLMPYSKRETRGKVEPKEFVTKLPSEATGKVK